MGFQNNSFYVRKKSLPTKVLSSSTLTYVNFYISIKFIVVFRVNMSQNSTFQYIQLFDQNSVYRVKLSPHAKIQLLLNTFKNGRKIKGSFLLWAFHIHKEVMVLLEWQIELARSRFLPLTNIKMRNKLLSLANKRSLRTVYYVKHRTKKIRKTPSGWFDLINNVRQILDQKIKMFSGLIWSRELLKICETVHRNNKSFFSLFWVGYHWDCLFSTMPDPMYVDLY